MSAWKTARRCRSTITGRTGFNGATPMSAWKTSGATDARTLRLQWGHADVGVEDTGGCGARRAYGGLQWGHADVGVEDAAPSRTSPAGDSFNGATPMSAWKTRRQRPARRAGVASMGPRRCRRGRLADLGSGGASMGLQWGHADVGVEDVTPVGRRRVARLASMGPRRCRRGRRSTVGSPRPPWSSFNGATPMSAWKTPHFAIGYRRDDLASMGPRRCRRGRRPNGCRVALLTVLQWGHADVGVEDRAGGPVRPSTPAGFNGATPMSAWKTARLGTPCKIAGCAGLRERLSLSVGPVGPGRPVGRPKPFPAGDFRLARGGRL